MKLNGPFTVELKVLIINDNSGQAGEITLGMANFTYPSEDQIKQAIQKIDFKASGIDGFRLMTKKEAVNYLITGSSEITYAVPGSKDWD